MSWKGHSGGVWTAVLEGQCMLSKQWRHGGGDPRRASRSRDYQLLAMTSARTTDTILSVFFLLASLSLSERVKERVSERPIRRLRIPRHTTSSSSVQASQAPTSLTLSPPQPQHHAPRLSALPSSNAPSQSPTASSASFSNRAALLRYANSVSMPV